MAKDFGQVRIETIETDDQSLEISTQPTDNIKKIEFCDLFTWIFNSSDKSAQYFLSKESNNDHRSGSLVWKLLTTKNLRGFKQGIGRAQNTFHILYLDNFDNNIKSLVKALNGNCKVLASCGESESSIIANLLRLLKKSPSYECISYFRHFQDKYDDGTNIDIDNFMRDVYESLVEDGQWDTKPEKEVEILALTSQIQELNILLSEHLKE